MNIGLFKSGCYVDVYDELKSFVNICKTRFKIVKVIIETNLLTPDEIIHATKIVESTGADFIKTCTGFFGSVKIDDIKLIHKTCPNLPIKASGGIKTIEQIEQMLKYNVQRIGTSSEI